MSITDLDVEREPVVAAVKSRPSARTLLWRGTNTLMIVIVAAALVVVAGSVVGWWREEVVLSGSMRPGIQPGDVEILRPEAASAVRVGQIVAFHPPHADEVITHRVVAVDRDAKGTFITTRGDANNADDSWGQIRLESGQVWHVTHVVPKIGYLTVRLRDGWGRLALTLALVGLAGGIALRRIWRT